LKKTIGLITVGIIALAGLSATALDTALSIRQIRDPVQLREKLNANFTELAGGTNLPDGVVSKSSSVTTNISASAYVTNATATAVFTPQTVSITYPGVDGSTNTLAVVTNGTIAVTVTLQKATPVAQNASIDFVQGCATNAP
jgi:hypothetical protein